MSRGRNRKREKRKSGQKKPEQIKFGNISTGDNPTTGVKVSDVSHMPENRDDKPKGPSAEMLMQAEANARKRYPNYFANIDPKLPHSGIVQSIMVQDELAYLRGT